MWSRCSASSRVDRPAKRSRTRAAPRAVTASTELEASPREGTRPRARATPVGSGLEAASSGEAGSGPEAASSSEVGSRSESGSGLESAASNEVRSQMESASSNEVRSRLESAASNEVGSRLESAPSTEAGSGPEAGAGLEPVSSSEAGSRLEAASPTEAGSRLESASPSEAGSLPESASSTEPSSRPEPASSTEPCSQRARGPAALAARRHPGTRGAARLGRGPRPARRPAPPCSGRARRGSKAWSPRVPASSTSMRTNVCSITKEPTKIRAPEQAAGLRHERARASDPLRGWVERAKGEKWRTEYPLAPEPGFGSARLRVCRFPLDSTTEVALERVQRWGQPQALGHRFGPARRRQAPQQHAAQRLWDPHFARHNRARSTHDRRYASPHTRRADEPMD
jgi:hypothetical protein